jgi:hypothetical protein
LSMSVTEDAFVSIISAMALVLTSGWKPPWDDRCL